MTLFKQIAIMMSIFLIILLLTVLTLNFKNASESVNERLYEDAKNTATSLSLSLGSANGDVYMMSTMINANFDSGHYGHIALVDVEDKLLYERVSETEKLDIPDWFLNAVEMQAPIASANVSAGWNPVGILNVQSDVSYAYIQLYTILRNLFISFVILAVIGLVVLNSFLIIILRPLKRVQLQAEAVARNEFIIEDTNIFTKEFKDVVIGMNTMVSKAKAMFDKGNEELKRQKELEYTDKVTQLKNRKYFMHKLPEYLKIDAVSKGGINILIELSGVKKSDEAIGHKYVDKLYMDIANILKSHADKYEHSIVAKMNETQFSVLLPDCSYEDGLKMVESINNLSKEIILIYELDSSKVYLSLGLCEYNYKDRVGVLFARADSALTHSKFLHNSAYLEKAQEMDEIMSNEEWKKVITKGIRESNFSFIESSVVDTKSKTLMHKSLGLILKADAQTTYSFTQFIIPANQEKMSNEIYKHILNMLFKTPDEKLKGSRYSLKLSYDYLIQDSTIKEMQKLFASHASSLPFKLIIELPDKLVRKNYQLSKEYKVLFEKYSIAMGIGEFIGESTDYQYLQELRPVYIKADSNYFIDQNENLLYALRLLADTVGISLIGTGVVNMKTLNKLTQQEIYIVEGEVTKVIEETSSQI